MKTLIKYPVGTKFRAKRDILFANGTSHKKGEIYVSTEQTQYYFNFNASEYEIFSKKTS